MTSEDKAMRHPARAKYAKILTEQGLERFLDYCDEQDLLADFKAESISEYMGNSSIYEILEMFFRGGVDAHEFVLELVRIPASEVNEETREKIRDWIGADMTGDLVDDLVQYQPFQLSEESLRELNEWLEGISYEGISGQETAWWCFKDTEQDFYNDLVNSLSDEQKAMLSKSLNK